MSIEIAPFIIVIIIIVAIISYWVFDRESDINLAIRRSKTLEDRLEKELNATEGGLEKKIKSVEHKLPSKTIQQLHKIRKERNALAHKKHRDNLKNRRRFERMCNDVEKELDRY